MIQAATSQNNLITEINGLLQSTRTYFSSQDFVIRRIEADARKLMKANPPEGHNVLAQLYGLVGDIEQALYHINVALNISRSAALECNKAGILTNLGYFKAAQEPYKWGASPERGEFTSRWTLGICTGSFHVLDEFESIARRMDFDLTGMNLDKIHRAVRLMDEHYVSDEALGDLLDVAGEILREERLFFSGEGPQIFVWDQDALEKHISINFQIPVSSRRASELDTELGRRLFEKVAEPPFFTMLNFESGLCSNDRFPERSAVAS